MKKFMIFLLMVVLYLGTSQARGEAPHYLNANLPLRSWIAPTHSFSMDAVVVTISPSQPQSYCVSCPVNSKTFGVSYTGLATGETVTGNRWFVNGNPTDSVGTTFTAAAYNAGTYTISCEVYTFDGSHAYTYRSNAVLLTVTPEIAVNIVGPTHACQNDIVTLTAQLDGTNLSPVSYQWRRNGQYIVGATEASYSFNVANLPGLTDTLVYEFDVQINRNGCESMYSPVHYFSVATTPVVNVVADLFCESAATTTLTATAYTNGDQQPYKYKWFKVGSTDTAITYVNTYVVTGAADADKYGVLPVYTDFSCNPITPGVVTLHTFESLTTETLKNIAVAAANENVCAGAQNVLSVTDENTAFGAATYAWYIDGQLINGVTGATYAANFDGVGAHAVRVVASYENYPCATKEAAASFNVEAAPTMLTITGDNVVCDGSNATLTASATGADTYLWSTGATTATINVGAGVYTVTATSTNGCETVSAPFTVNSFGANLQVAASAMSICAGENVVLTASEEGWTNNVTYQWKEGTNVISSSNVANVAPTATTTYTAYATDGTCEATADITITVNEALAAPTVAAAADPICAGEQVDVTANVTGAASYIWYMDGVEIPGENLAHLTFNVAMPGTHEFAAKAVGSTGCISALSAAAANVVVVAAPTLLTITGNNVVCADSTSKLTAHAEGTGVTYAWSEGTTGAIATVPAGVYAVTASTANGCAVVETFTVYEFGSQVQVTATPAIVCAGESVVLNAHEDRYVGNVNYTWSNGANANMTTVVPTESAWYKVTSSMGSCSRVDSVYVTVNPVPAVSALTVVEDTVCAGTQFTLSATATDAVSYVWFENGIEIAGNNMSQITLDKPAGVWSYNVAAVSAEGCRSELFATPAKVTVLANPSVQITGDPYICNDSTVTLYANINDTLNTLAQGADYNYEWRVYNYTVANGAVNDSPVGEYATFTSTGTTLTTNLHAREYPYIFTAQTTNANGCVATSDPYYVYVGDNINVAVTLDIDTVCRGGLVTATAHIGDYNMEHLVYQWYEVYDGAEHLIPSGTSPVYSSYVTHDPTTFKVKVTNTYTDCVAYGDSTAHIFNPVVKAVVLTTNGQSDEDVYVCEGATIEVVAYLKDETGRQYVDTTLRYVWKENGFLKPLVTGPYFQKQVGIYDEDSTSYTFECWIDFGVEGCEATQVASNTVHVRRNPIVVIEGNHNVCYFDNATPNVYLTAWVDGVADLTPTYTWYEHGHLRNNAAGFDNNYVEMWRPNYDNPYSFTVEVSYGNGCSRISDPFEVNVYNKPVVNITASETEICQGGEVALRANLDNYNDPMLTYQWYTNRVHQNHLIAGATHEFETFAPEADVNYIVRVIHLLYNDVYNANTQTCVAYDTIHVSVNADPVIANVESDLPASRTLCDGRSVTFTATTAGGVQGGEVYTWYRNGEVVEGANGPVLTETPHAENNYPTTYVYQVSVKQTASGCESTVYVADTLTVNPNPSLEIATDPIVCSEVADNIVMTANITPAPTTDYTFNWFEDNAALVGATFTGAHNEVATLHKNYRDYAYNFSVSLVNAYGCTAEAATSVLVNAAPVVNIVSTDTTLCVGGEITLTANLNDWNADELVYHWLDNGVVIPTATELTYTVVPALGEHVYTFTVDQLTSLCAATSNAVNVHVVADPIVTEITNDLNGVSTLCDGRSVTMTAHISGGVAGGEVYTWYRNGQVIEGATQATYTETPHAENYYPTTYSYTVSVRQAGEGCESNVFATPMVITVNPNPTLAIETDPIVCVEDNGNIVMTANVNPAPTTNYTFNWFEDNAALVGATYTGTHNEVATLTKPYRDYAYNFSVSLVNEYGCTATAETQVYVNAVPVVNIAATETNICEGGEITLTANLNDWNADQLEFHWYDNGTVIPTATETSYTLVPALGTHTYTFTVDQLTSLCHAISNELVVVVNPDPVIANVTLSDYTVCQGAQIAVTATPEDGNKVGDVYTWYRNGILMEGATAATIYDSPVTVDNNTQQFVYTAVLTRPEAGCQSLPVSAAALTVYPNPTVVITGDQHVCETDSIFLIANVDTIGAGVGALHYTWYESGMIRDNMAYNLGDNRFYAEYWYARTEPYRFTVNVEREGVPAGCASMSAEFDVYVYARPIVNITATETEICENGEVTLTANLVNPNVNNMVYQWYEVRSRVDSVATGFDANGNYTYTYVTRNYNSLIPGANSATYTTTLAATTTLGVVATQVDAECSNFDEITITVNPLPVVTAITVNGQGVDTVCNGAQVNLAATITPVNAEGAVYTWFRNGIEIVGANQSTFSENVYTNDNQVTTNVYTAIVTLPASGCQSLMSTVHADVIVNPAPSTVTVTGNNIICENSTTTLTVYSDVEGTITWSTGSHASSIDVPAGSYNVTVVTPEGCEMTSENFNVTALGTDLFITASETAICEGEHTTLYANQDGWQGNVSYLWDANANNSTSTTVDVQPATTTTYTVTATVNSTNGTCSAVGNVTIVVTPRPAQVHVTASVDSICEGQQVTFNADGDAYAYIWYQNGVEIPGENRPVLTVNFPVEGAYTFQAKAINDQNCESAEASEPVTINVYSAPEQVVISGNTVICGTGSTTLYANVTPNVAGATYQWYKDNVVIAGATNSSYETSVAGSYKVDVTTHGCTTTSDAVNVFVQEAPQLQLTATETTICQNGTTVITAEATGWNNADVNYTWNNGFQGSVYTFAPTAAGDYTFSVTASQATSGCVAVDAITIHVNPAPAAPVVTVNNPIVCEGAQITLTLTDTNTVDYGTPTISWLNNGIEIAGNLNVITLTPALGVNTYNAVVTYPNSGCNTAVSANLVVNVLAVPTVAIEVAGNTTLCDNGTTTLIANVTPANVTYNYTWLRDNVEIAGENAQALTVTLPARETAYNYTVIVSSYPGCVQTADQAITVVPDPVVVANVSNSIICEGGNATFTAEVTNAGVPAMNGLYTYAWYNNLSNDTDAPLATTPSYTVSNAVAGNYAYRVVVTSPYGCETTSNIVNFSVVADPQVAVVVTPGFDATICEGGSTQLIANVTGGYGEPSYQWLVNGVVIPGATDRTYNVANVELANNNIYNVVVRQTGVDCIAQSNNTVNPFTVVEHYAPYITGNANVCEGGFVTLTANVPNAIAGDAVTYEWHMNGQTVGTSNTYTTDPLTYGGTYFYDVTVHSAISGCSYTADAVQANVAQAPQVSILGGDINGNFTICENGQLVLNASVDTTAGQYVSGAPFTYTWRWFGAAAGSATTATPQFTFPALAANDALSNPYFVEVSISRNDNSGCASTSEAHQVNINAVPSVNITANRAYVCEGGEVTFTANVAPVNAAYDYEWYVNGVRVMSNTQSITRTLNTVGNVNVMVIVSSANSAASCDDTATLVVPVHVVADPVVTITANHTAMCAGGSTTLSVANINVNNNIASDYTYQWAINGTEVPGAVASTFVQQLNTPGTYNYTLRVSQNENLGCVSQWSAPVTVLVAEQPEVTLTSINGLDICEGGSITMTATVNNYSNTNNGALNSSIYGPMTYTWMANGNNVQVNANVNNGSNQITETLNTVGNYNYIVYVTPSGYNCQPVASNINTVHVLNNPTWTDIVVRYPEMCFGETVELSANIVGGTSDFSGNTAGSIQWMVSHNGVNSQVSGGLGGNSFDTPAAAGSYVYYPTFVGNMGSGCHLADSAAVQQHVTVYATPTAHFLGNDTICANDADQAGLLTIEFTGGAPYSFDIENMMTGEILPYHASATDVFSFYVQPDVTTAYRLTMLASGHGCSNDNIGAETMATVYVTSVDFAETLFAASCDDDNMTINFNVISSYTDQYAIVENGTVIAQGTIVNNTATFAVPTEPGDHFVQFVIGGCTYDIVLRVPVTGFAGATAPLMDIRWDDVVIINTNPETNGGHTFVSFQWYRNGELIPGATYKNYQEVGGLNGYYSVELTEIDANGNLVTYVTCEQAFASLAAVKVYPVPAKVQQEITLELDLTAEELEGATLDIYNALGAQVSHMTNLKPINKISGFTAQGTYFGRIITGTNDVKTVKFVIVK